MTKKDKMTKQCLKKLQESYHLINTNPTETVCEFSCSRRIVVHAPVVAPVVLPVLQTRL